MAEPPRLESIALPWDMPVVYFVTLCVAGRERVLANDLTFDAVRDAFAALRNWRTLAAVLMPDHLHLIVSPRDDRGRSIGDFSSGFKRILRKELGSQTWNWQRGCFDRLLRSDEDLTAKWMYVRDNPVRAGLVGHAAEWPYYIELDQAAPASTPVGEAASFPPKSNHHPMQGS